MKNKRTNRNNMLFLRKNIEKREVFILEISKKTYNTLYFAYLYVYLHGFPTVCYFGKHSSK